MSNHGARAHRQTAEYRAAYKRARALFLDKAKYPANPDKLTNRGQLSHVTKLMQNPAFKLAESRGWARIAVKKVSAPTRVVPMLETVGLENWYMRGHLFVASAFGEEVTWYEKRAEIVVHSPSTGRRRRILLDVSPLSKEQGGFQRKLRDFSRLIDGEAVAFPEMLGWLNPNNWGASYVQTFDAFMAESMEYRKNGMFSGGLKNMALVAVADFDPDLLARKMRERDTLKTDRSEIQREARAFNLSGKIRGK